MTHIIHRHLHVTPPVAVGGRGVFLVDADGKDYLDASGGAAVSCLGHGHPAVTAAMHAQIDRLAYAHTSFFTTEPAEALADQLTRTAPAGLDHVQPHRHVGVEVAARIGPVRADAADLGGEVHDHVRPLDREQPADRLLLGQVVVGPARHDHRAGAALAQKGADAAAEKFGAAGDQDALAREPHHSARPERQLS